MQIRTVLAIAAWSLVAIAALGQAQQKSKMQFGKPIPAADRIDQLQKGFQSALDDLSQTKTREILTHDENGKLVKMKVAASFGTRRMPTFSIVHDNAIDETDVVAFVPIPEGQLLFWAVSSRGKPLAPGKMTLHKDTATDAPQIAPAEQKQIEAFASTALPTLADKDVYAGQIEGNDVQARPLRLSKPECITCHPGSKLKDPAAIMVYMIKKIKPR